MLGDIQHLQGLVALVHGELFMVCEGLLDANRVFTLEVVCEDDFNEFRLGCIRISNYSFVTKALFGVDTSPAIVLTLD